MDHLDDDDAGTSAPPPAAASSKLDAVTDAIAAYPVGAIVASVAVGAGLMALLSAASHRAPPPPPPPPPRRPVERAAEAAAASYADLQVQLTQLVRNMAAMIPTKADAREATQAAQNQAQAAGASASRTWGQLADEAQQVFRGLAPGAQSAGQVVREHPVLASVAVGMLGALAASLALRRGEDGGDTPPPPEQETPPPM